MGFCRDCFAEMAEDAQSCAACSGARLVAHPELAALAIAHIDCDAFYAAIEKRDNPALKDRAVLVGGDRGRSVVMTACYLARKSGAKSAMPMFQALRLCPDAVVVPPRMAKYSEVARELRAMMRGLTPLVEPLSLDEAYLDLTGTERAHGMSPAQSLARLAKRIEAEIGITVSVGLSHNKFLAKLASDLKKPRGFAIIGQSETISFLRDRPVGVIRGVGPVLEARLKKDGIERIGQIQDADERALERRYGKTGTWLYRFLYGNDPRAVEPDGELKSISAETTFDADSADKERLERVLRDLADRVSARAKKAEIGGATVTLKLKTARFQLKTRSASLEHPTLLAHVIFAAGRSLLAAELANDPGATQYRLLGIGLSRLHPAAECDPPDLFGGGLFGGGQSRATSAEHAFDTLRAKFGASAIRKGMP